MAIFYNISPKINKLEKIAQIYINFLLTFANFIETLVLLFYNCKETKKIGDDYYFRLFSTRKTFS